MCSPRKYISIYRFRRKVRSKQIDCYTEAQYTIRTLLEEADFRPSGFARWIIVNFRGQQRPSSNSIALSLFFLMSTDENELLSLPISHNYFTFRFSVFRSTNFRADINARHVNPAITVTIPLKILIS